MNNLPLDIITFARREDILNEQRLSQAQIAYLKSIYGLTLTVGEREIYFRCTGRSTYDEREQGEVTLIAGRRAGKTIMAAIIAIYEAFRAHGLPEGEQGYVMLLAATMAQSRIAFRYISNYFRRSSLLSDHLVKITKDEITLDNGIVIGCHTSSHDGVRGRTVVAVICDEISFWPYGEDAANPADEVLGALRPAMATLRNTKVIKISTPFAKAGILWDEYQRRGELDYAVWQVGTFEMNPTVTPHKVERERRLSEEKYQREYLAQFTDSINGWIDPEILNPCIVRGRKELYPQSGVNYIAAIDPASRGNDFTMVILHVAAGGTIVVDRTVCWTGSKKAPLPFEAVLSELSCILSSYYINTVTGDQFYCDAIAQHLLRLGITYKIFTFGPKTRGTIFCGLKHLIVHKKIELLDEVRLLRELRNLQEERTERGDIDVRPTSGRDDTAVALALAVNEAVNLRSPLPFDVLPADWRSDASLGLIPDQCRFQAPCTNCPACIDAEVCLGFSI